jgi:hypothetical protein
MERKEYPKGYGEYFVRKPSLRRQRVVARHRPENISTQSVETKSITRRQTGVFGGWLRRWLPWFPTPVGGRL